MFLAGDLAYKVKKPVTLPFLDYGTVERRRAMCRDEVVLNRRLAPRIYLGVVAIVRTEGRYALAEEGDPEAVEFAVEMRRVEEERSLESLAGTGELRGEHVAAVARLLASFHDAAEVAPLERRTLEALTAPLWENLDTLRESGAEALGAERLDAAQAFTRRFVVARGEQMAERGGEGLVRDGHGDLRAEHAIVPAREEPYVYDCVEFNSSLRHIDVSADLAFLVMDLARLGEESMATRLVEVYREQGGDPGDDPLLSFHAAYRAWVRAKIALLRVAELGDAEPDRERQLDQARELFDLGRRFAWCARLPLVVVVCGVAASGKTTLARELARVAGLAHVSSDLTRKRLAGLDPEERGTDELYSAEHTMRTYRELGAAAATGLRERGGAIVDATFHRREERDAFRKGLGEVEAPVLYVECRAPAEVLMERVREREWDPGRASDAGAAIVERQLAEREPLDEVPEGRRAALDTDRPAERLAARVEALLDERIWATGP